MSVGPLGFLGSIAGAPSAQRANDSQRAQTDAVARNRQADSNQKAADAAGVGATDAEDTQSHERDADGRRLWEPPDKRPKAEDAAEPPTPPVPPKDASGESGNLLDLTG